VEQIGKSEFRIILTQGLNRQIRRMCEYLDYKVVSLQRIRIMNMKLDVSVGKWRYFTDVELQELNRLVETSTKTFIDKKNSV
jgi:23S rRNA pseudouridine2604 synthase